MAGKRVEKLAVTLDKIFAARGLAGRLKEYRVYGQWERIVGKVIARHARPLSLRAKKLVVQVDSSAWMQQLSLLKPEIIEKANRSLGQNSVKSITLKLGEVSAPSRPPDEQPLTGSLTHDERARIEDYIKDLADPAVREALRHVMEKDFVNKKREKKTAGGKQ